MLRGKQRKDASIKLRSETGLFVTEEGGIVIFVRLKGSGERCLLKR